jgi:hypothetical protein
MILSGTKVKCVSGIVVETENTKRNTITVHNACLRGKPKDVDETGGGFWRLTAVTWIGRIYERKSRYDRGRGSGKADSPFGRNRVYLSTGLCEGIIPLASREKV